jgi:hypothetical protein
VFSCRSTNLVERRPAAGALREAPGQP